MPVQVRCTILDAWGWCTGTTQRDGMGREEGGGFRMGKHWLVRHPHCGSGVPTVSKGLSRVFSNTTVQKHQFFGA